MRLILETPLPNLSPTERSHFVGRAMPNFFALSVPTGSQVALEALILAPFL
ncbi:hypothetical protein [Nostoc sp.]|uniref:hypothetical protein n=1 Tax=Nostoc sp. TaxID=1180 RepID=UPI002FFBEB44